MPACRGFRQDFVAVLITVLGRVSAFGVVRLFNIGAVISYILCWGVPYCNYSIYNGPQPLI